MSYFSEQESCARFRRVCDVINEYLRDMSPQEKDRMMQRHLAQARTKEQNLRMLAEMTDAMLDLRAAKEREGISDRNRTVEG